MAPKPDELRDRFRATLLGCAIGDALGFPLEGLPPEAIVRIPELAEDFVPRPRGRFQKGQFTDDTQLTVALLESIVSERKVDGRAVAARFAQLWTGGIILAPTKSCSEAVERLLKGVPWMSAGAPLGEQDNSAAVRAAPLGMWHLDDLGRIPRDAELQGVITHKDVRAQAGGAAFAAAVALNLSGEALPSDLWCRRVAQVVAAMDAEFASEIDRLGQLARFEPASAVKVLAHAGLPAHVKLEWPGISPLVMPSVLAAFYAFLRERENFRGAVGIALRFGGDVDSVAAMTGALSGAWLGTLGIPARLRKGVLASDGLQAAADRLFFARQTQKDQPAVVGAGARTRR